MIGWLREEVQYAIGDNYIYTDFNIVTDVEHGYWGVGTYGIVYLHNDTTDSDILANITSVDENVIYVSSGINKDDRITVRYYADFDSDPALKGETLTKEQISDIASALAYLDTHTIVKTNTLTSTTIIYPSYSYGSLTINDSNYSDIVTAGNLPCIISQIIFYYDNSKGHLSEIYLEIDGTESVLTVGRPGYITPSSTAIEVCEVYEKDTDRDIIKIWFGALRVNSSIKCKVARVNGGTVYYIVSGTS